MAAINATRVYFDINVYGFHGNWRGIIYVYASRVRGKRLRNCVNNRALIKPIQRKDTQHSRNLIAAQRNKNIDPERSVFFLNTVTHSCFEKPKT